MRAGTSRRISSRYTPIPARPLQPRRSEAPRRSEPQAFRAEWSGAPVNGILPEKVDELLERFEDDGVTRANLENWEKDERRRLGVRGANGVNTKHIERHMHVEYIVPDSLPKKRDRKQGVVYIHKDLAKLQGWEGKTAKGDVGAMLTTRYSDPAHADSGKFAKWNRTMQDAANAYVASLE